METPEARTTGPTMISVQTDDPGIVLRVRGTLDARGVQLLDEVARAALLTMKRARRIHLDLAHARTVRGVPRIVHQMRRAGALVTLPSSPRAAPRAPRPRGSAMTSRGATP